MKVFLRGSFLTQRSFLTSQRFESFRRPEFDPAKHINNSEVHTLSYQKKLPKQPIPSLESTGKQLVRAASGLKNHPKFTEDSIAAISEKWADFAKTEGILLDQLVREEDEANPDTSYINAPWKRMYLSDRRTLICNYNPSIQLNTLGLPYLDQLRTATAITLTLAKFHSTYKDGYLEPDGLKMGGQFIPLDMSQFENLLFSTRIPRQDVDEIVKEESKHFAVLYRGRFYKVEIFLSDGSIRSPEEILAEFEFIKTDGQKRGTIENSVTSLSLGERNRWAENREKLIELGNSKQLKLIDSALTLIVLDDFTSKTSRESMKNTIAGPGNNRFPDKSFSMIIGQDSSASFTFEHGWGDGKAIDTIGNQVFNYLKALEDNKTPLVTSNTVPDFAKVSASEIVFKIDDEITSEIRAVREEYEEMVSGFSVHCLEIGKCPAFTNRHWYEPDREELENIEIGRKWMKNLKIPPDAFQQLGMQITAAHLRGHPVIQYEATSLAAFKHGRTETIRPATKEASAAVDAYENLVKNPVDQKAKLDFASKLIDAMKAHNKQIKLCFGGKGFDRHLFALRNKAAESNVSHPLFQDESFQELFQFAVSTSTLSGNAMLQGGFGPVTPDGYGIGYICRSEHMAFWVSGFPASGGDPEEFCKTMKTVLLDMKSVLDLAASLQ